MKNLNEIGKGIEKIKTVISNLISDKGKMKAKFSISRWASEEDRKAGKIYTKEEALKLFRAPQFTTFERNCLLNSGINELFTIICSSGGTKWDNTNAQLGVGNSNTAESATQTDLQGTNKTYKGMMTGYPTYGTNQKATWKAQFTENEANYDWNEFVVRNGATAQKCLNRKVSAQGTKTSGQVWELTLEISLS
jgi:hypothetical protein